MIIDRVTRLGEISPFGRFFSNNRLNEAKILFEKRFSKIFLKIYLLLYVQKKYKRMSSAIGH